MHGRVTAGRPAASGLQHGTVGNFADEKFAGGHALTLHLRMATQAKIRIGLREHFAIGRSVWIVANRAAFAHRFMFKHKWTRLFAMTLRAAFVQARHRKTARRTHDVATVRIVALNAIHPAFNHRMMLRQVELGVSFQMALKTGVRVFAGIDDELPTSSARGNMFAARSMTRFASGQSGHCGVIEMHACMRTEGE